MSKMRVQDVDDSDSDNIPDGPNHFKMLDMLECPNRPDGLCYWYHHHQFLLRES